MRESLRRQSVFLPILRPARATAKGDLDALRDTAHAPALYRGYRYVNTREERSIPMTSLHFSI